MFSKAGFEISTCPRCAGSGQYSYCQSYGTKCFKCAGSKVAYTKRGKAAFDFMAASLKVPVEALAVGQMVQIDNFFQGVKYFAPITEIKAGTQKGASLKDGVMVPYEVPTVEVTTVHAKYGRSGMVCFAGEMVRKAWSPADKAAKLAAAVAYQATLTQAGTPQKKVAKAA